MIPLQSVEVRVLEIALICLVVGKAVSCLHRQRLSVLQRAMQFYDKSN